MSPRVLRFAPYWVGGACWVCFGLGGCGESHPPTYPVSGQVLFSDGKPLSTGGRVEFISSEIPRVRATGYFGEDGKYQLTTYEEGDGAIAGEHDVIVVPAVPGDGDGLSAREYAQAMQPIAEHYKIPGSSGIKITVAADVSPQEFKIEVTRPRRRR